MFLILLQRAAVYEDVIKEGCAEDVQKVSDGVIYEMLETAGGVGEAKRHDLVFEMAVSRPECCLPLLPFGNAEVVVAIAKVEFSVPLRLLQASQRFLDQRERVPVLYCHLVQAPVINTEA